jgi:glutathione S-transferase
LDTVAAVSAKLYSLSLSHPSQAARLMLERKGIEHEIKDLLPGFHPLQLRLAGFRGGTVPALRIDGRRIQGSLEISRALDEFQAEPPLFPAEPERRRAAEEAERWGERELQPVPRRIFRWTVVHRPELRRWLAAEIGFPAPGVVAMTYAPLGRYFAAKVGANDAAVKADLAGLPALIDRVDALIAEGTLGGDDLNPADYQIAATVRVLLAFDDLRPLVEGRPSGELALRVLPRFPGPIRLALPAEWLPQSLPGVVGRT